MTHPRLLFPLDSSVLNAPVVDVYKSDGRTKVWTVNTVKGWVVIKRFERHPLRQALAGFFGIHPAQIEARRSLQLRAAGLPVPPILASGIARGRRWHVTFWVGKSLLWSLRDGDLSGRSARLKAIHVLSEMVAKLIARGWIHADLKTSNIIIRGPFHDSDGELIRDNSTNAILLDAFLIDVGAVEPIRPGKAGAQQVAHMLATLNVGAKLDKATKADRLRFLRYLVDLRPQLGDVKTLAREVGRIVLK